MTVVGPIFSFLFIYGVYMVRQAIDRTHSNFLFYLRIDWTLLNVHGNDLQIVVETRKIDSWTMPKWILYNTCRRKLRRGMLSLELLGNPGGLVVFWSHLWGCWSWEWLMARTLTQIDFKVQLRAVVFPIGALNSWRRFLLSHSLTIS